jgi:hypothetical protein
MWVGLLALRRRSGGLGREPPGAATQLEHRRRDVVRRHDYFMCGCNCATSLARASLSASAEGLRRQLRALDPALDARQPHRQCLAPLGQASIHRSTAEKRLALPLLRIPHVG